MGNVNIPDLIKDLYQDYNNCVRPLIVLVETQTNKFPIGLLNEIRAFNDHISRAFLDDLSDDNKKDELKAAERHLYRTKYDCYKVLILNEEDNIQKFLNQYINIKIADVGSGRFYLKFKNILINAKQLAREGKQLESKGRYYFKEALELYEKSYATYLELGKFIEDNDDNLIYAISNLREKNKKEIIVGLIIGIVSSAIVTGMGFLTRLLVIFIQK
ncbi:MAG: hypothetical protein ACYDIA_25955 [Candidatus Humimicrobiaceae bacterium]